MYKYLRVCTSICGYVQVFAGICGIETLDIVFFSADIFQYLSLLTCMCEYLRVSAGICEYLRVFAANGRAQENMLSKETGVPIDKYKKAAKHQYHFLYIDIPNKSYKANFNEPL